MTKILAGAFTAGLMFAAAGSASADPVLYSDLGTGSSVYDALSGGAIVKGSGAGGNSIEQARAFTVSGSGAFDVTQIDFGIGHNIGADTFAASIWTDSSGHPGTQLGLWDLTAAEPLNGCCMLSSKTGITGVTLTGGDTYFMVLAPVSLTDNSDNEWQPNTVGANGVILGSLTGGATWISDGRGTQPAFDVQGTAHVENTVPEPASLLLLGGGLAGLFAARRKRSK